MSGNTDKLARMAEFDRAWAGGDPAPNCPSCNGTGWATIRVSGITVAGGRCVCRGGTVNAKPAALSALDGDT